MLFSTKEEIERQLNIDDITENFANKTYCIIIEAYEHSFYEKRRVLTEKLLNIDKMLIFSDLHIKFN